MMSDASAAVSDHDRVIYDRETLADLGDLFGKERLAHLLAGLDDEIARRLDPATAQSARLGADAHALVSISGTLGFAALSEACAALERACLDGENPDAALRQAQAEAARARPVIAELRAGMA